MASSAGSSKTSGAVKHKLNTEECATLPQIPYSRTVSAGKPIAGEARVISYRTEPATGYTLPVQRVDTYEDYMSGCREHDKCLGHFCITPRGTVLLPQRLSSSLGIISNEYARAVESVYSRDSYGQELSYRNKIRSMMFKKSGRMRGDMPAGVVDSSARGVLSLSWKLKTNQIAVPRRLASNMRVLRVPKVLVNLDTEEVIQATESGAVPDNSIEVHSGHYVEDRLREGDWVVVVRPPSLWAGNVQPMKVVLWEKECFGMNPGNTDEFHADHDGDEIQIYFVGTPDAVAQCEAWKPLNKDKFTEALKQDNLPASLQNDPLRVRERFMSHTTLSMEQLVNGMPLPPLSKVSRFKEAMADMFAHRLNNPELIFSQFVKDSLQGIVDVMKQQLNQGTLGDMSRQAKLAATCIQYRGGGVFEIKAGTQTILSTNLLLQDIDSDDRYPLGGNPCIRAISAMCSVAQQAALDSHRVSQDTVSSFDLIKNFMQGGSSTLVLLAPGIKVPGSWTYSSSTVTYCLSSTVRIRSRAASIIGSYSPDILKAVKLLKGDVRHVCAVGTAVVCNYYSVKLTTLEFWSLVELMCYRCEVSERPITTKQGLLSRDMRWLVSVFANHYATLELLQGRSKTKRSVKPETSTDASSFCNFDYLQ